MAGIDNHIIRSAMEDIAHRMEKLPVSSSRFRHRPKVLAAHTINEERIADSTPQGVFLSPS